METISVMNNPQGNTVSEVRASTEELIARLENAMEPDHFLDWKILLAVADEVDSDGEEITASARFNEYWYVFAKCPTFTESIDAALMLVPEGSDWERDGGWVRIVRACGFGSTTEAASDHPKPAIALCIAALKARKATGTTDTHRDSVNEQRA